MISLFNVIDVLLGFLETMMAVYGIFSLLLFFGVLNPHGRIAGMLWQNLQGLFEPMLQYLRRFVPPYRGFDWSFMVLYLLIIFVRSLLREYGPLAKQAVESMGP
jgi:YggT family protein